MVASMGQDHDATQTIPCTMDAARATALAATLGVPTAFAQGDALPPFWHLAYFWDPHPPEALGRDGHPTTGGLIPDMGLPRRMWAAGGVSFHQPLRVGIPADCVTVREAVTRKQGRSGPLGFVRLRHDIRQRRGLCITEWQELVYRPDRAPNEAAPASPVARTDEDYAEPFVADPTVLFRFSALTFNGHRIHYDVDYARAVEGYAGLVVHGPLLALLLAALAERKLGSLRDFRFRATAPLIHGEEAMLCWADGALWVRGPEGRLCMEATAR